MDRLPEHEDAAALRALRPVRFDTADLPAAARFEAWHAVFSSVNHIHLPAGAQARFAARNENWRLGSMLLTRNRTPEMGFERSARHIRRDGLDHFVLRVLLRGRTRSAWPGMSFETRPGQLVLFGLGDAWESRWSEAEWLSLCVPRDASPELSSTLERLGSGPVRLPGAGLMADYLALLARRLDGATVAEVPSLTRATQAMVLASLQGEAAPNARIEEALARTQFERARLVIARHLGEASLTPERLARQCGIARSSLYRCFEPHGGVARYIQAERLRQVRRMLMDPALGSVSVAQLAERVGFFDASAFSRLFRRTYAQAPRAFRQAALAGLGAPGVDRCLPETGFGAMLRALGER